MRRDHSPPRGRAAAAVLIGLGLLLWRAPPDMEAASGWLGVLAGAPVTAPPAPQPLGVRQTAFESRAPRAPRAAATAASGFTPPPSSRPAFTHAIASAPVEVSLLPPASREASTPEGLPAAATHCHWEGGLLKCGGCQSSADCAQDEGCFINRETRQMECLASECEDDSHCFAGTTCRELKTGTSNAAVIRRCMPVGERAVGESCDPDYISRAGACREGLRCLNQLCTRPCQLADPTGCPAGHTCLEDSDGPGCVPDCEQLGCPTGEQCKRLPRGGNRCLARVTGSCPETPCGPGERCLVEGSRSRGSFWCARECGALRPGDCAAEEVCGWAGGTTSACFRQCDPQRLDSCGEGWMCATVAEDLSVWGCRPSAFD